MNKRILIADDDEAICESVVMILEDAGYNASYTTDGQSLLEFKKNFPDLILLDIWMSGIDGRDVCKYLKKNKATSKIPVIIISANNETEKIAKEAGADGFISKPFDIDHLLDYIAKHLKS